MALYVSDQTGNWSAAATWGKGSWCLGAPSPVPVEEAVSIGGGGRLTIRLVDALDDDALLLSLLGLWMDD